MLPELANLLRRLQECVLQGRAEGEPERECSEPGERNEEEFTSLPSQEATF
jgi:hypothetical protein